jgi:hypothetical protein
MTLTSRQAVGRSALVGDLSKSPFKAAAPLALARAANVTAH